MWLVVGSEECPIVYSSEFSLGTLFAPIFISICLFIRAKSTLSGSSEGTSVQLCGGGKMGSVVAGAGVWWEGSVRWVEEGGGGRRDSRVWDMGTLTGERNGGPPFISSVISPIPRNNRFT